MSLIDCPECSRQISDKAPFCPGCGFITAESGNIPTLPQDDIPDAVSYTTDNSDRRKGRRINRADNSKIKRIARLKINNELALLIDLSRDGIKFSMAEVPVDSNLSITLQIEDQVYELTGAIRWYSKSGSFINFKEIGVAIKNAPETYYNLIKRLETH